MQNKTNKYARTLFDVAKQYNMLENMTKQLFAIKHLYKKEATFRLLFTSKRMTEDVKKAIIKNILSDFDNASVLEISSPKTRIMSVIITVAYKIPSVLVNSINIFVARAEATTLTKLLANKIVQISSSLSLKTVSKILAFFFSRFS